MKLLKLTLLIYSLLANTTFAQDEPSIKDSLLKFIEKAPSSVAAYENICGKEIDENFPLSQDSWGPMCEVLKSDELCKDVEAEDKLDCKDVSEAYTSYWSALTTKECAWGALLAMKDFVVFVGEAFAWAYRQLDSTERDKTKEQANEAYLALEGYIATETLTLEQQALANGFNEEDAKKDARDKLWSKVLSNFMQKLASSIEKSYLHLGCYTPKARSREMCKLISSYVVPPTAAIALMTRGAVKVGIKVAKNINIDKKIKGSRTLANATSKSRKVALKSAQSSIKSSMKDLGYSRFAIKKSQQNVNSWLDELAELSIDQPKENQLLYSRLLEDLKAKNPQGAENLAAIAGKYKAGADPFSLIKDYYRPKPKVESIEKTIISLSDVPVKQRKMMNHFYGRLKQENPLLYNELLNKLETSKVLDQKKLTTLMRSYSKHNNPSKAIKDAMIPTVTPKQYIPLKLTLGSNKKRPYAKPRQQARDYLYKSIKPTNVSNYKVYEIGKNKYGIKVKPHEVYGTPLEAKLTRRTAYDSFQTFSEEFDNAMQVIDLIKRKVPSLKNRQIKKILEKACKK
jgi:hypothetical protein